ncbi:MAG: ABC transporter permease [Candidatus Rokubacteria bacterium]|nr:ABC transporter permease [Candidatus Rokubacteria bacterium]
MRDVWRRFEQNRMAMAGAVIVVVFLLVTLFASWLAPHDPTRQDLLLRLAGPSPPHPLGHDGFGRDVLSRLIVGARLSFGMAFFAVLLAFSVGTPLGLVAGYVGGLVDTVVMRLTDILMTFPGMLLALVFVAVLGVGATNVTIAIGVATVPIFVRMVRGSVLVVKHLEFVQSARALGARAARIMGRHVLPNIVGPIVILATLRMATAILTAAALSFIGLGVQPPAPEWGAMLAEGKAYLRVAPHVVVFPGITIMVVVLAFNLMGDGLRDALDPSTTIEGRTDS